MKTKTGEELLNEFEAHTISSKINPINDDTQIINDVQTYSDSFQQYNDPTILDRNRVETLPSVDGGASLLDTEVNGQSPNRNLKSYEYQDPNTQQVIQGDPNQAMRSPNAVERDPAEQFVGGGRSANTPSPKDLTKKPNQAAPPVQKMDFSKQPIVIGADRNKPVVAEKAPDYKPMDFDSLKVQNESRIKQTEANQKKANAVLTGAKAKAVEQEALALQDEALAYEQLGQVDQAKAEDLAKLDSDREEWKLRAEAKAPPRGWGERILDGIAVFLGGVGLKGGEPNQVFNFVMNKMEQRSKEFIAEKNNAIEMLKKLNELDPRIKKTPENVQRMQRYWQGKAIQKMTEARIKMAQTDVEKAKLMELNSEAKKETNKNMNELYTDNLKTKEAQKNKEREVGMLGDSHGIVYKPDQIKSPADQERAVVLPDGKNVMLAKTKKDVETVNTMKNLYSLVSRNLAKLDTYMDKTSALGRMWDKMGLSEQAGILQSINNELLNAARIAQNTGVLNKGEMPILEKGFPSDPTALSNIGYMKGLSKGLRTQVTNKYKDTLTNAGLVNKKTGKPDINWFGTN